jgi:UDPglucose--hexose-1-phosphate uridylyltransferase
MELRKDPITRSWVVLGHPENPPAAGDGCPLCPGHEGGRPTLLALPSEGPWQVRVTPHLDPLYRIEGEPSRQAEGIYDKMRLIGAHEIIVETPEHNRPLAQLSDEQIERVLQAYAQRIQDLKRDSRFKYVTVFKNHGAVAGQEWTHSHSQVTATTFVPRRILYELRASREWHAEKERCVFCDIVRQEEKQARRIVDTQGDYVALCPYASRVPYEVWMLDRRHNSLFEQPRPGANRRNLAVLLGRTLRRISKIAPAYHFAVHTSPNTSLKGGEFRGFWKTIAEDYHWHIEILPIVETRSKSYSIKEVYFNALLPEEAAEKLRQIDSRPETD